MAMGTTVPQNYFLPTTISSADAKIGHVSHGGPGQVKVEARASPSLSPVVGDQLAGHGDDRDALSPFQFHVNGDVQAYQQHLILEHQQQQQILRQHLLQSGYPSSALSSPFAFRLHAPSPGYGHGVAQGLSHDPPPSASSSITSSSSNSLFSVNGRGAASPARSDPSSTGGESVVVGTAGSNHPPIATPAPLYRFGASSGSQNIGPNIHTNPSAHNYNYASAYTPSTSQSQPQAVQQRHSSNSSRSGGFSSSSKAGGSGANSPQGWTPQQQQLLAQQQQQQLRYQREQQIRLQQHLANSQTASGKLHTSDVNLGQNLGRQHLSNNTHHHSHSVAQPQPHHQLSASNTAHLNHHLNQQTTLHNSHHTSSLPHTPQQQLPGQARTHFHQSNHNHSHGAPTHRFSGGSLGGIPMSYSDDYDGYNEFDDVNEIPASELGAAFATLTSGGTVVNPGGPGGILLEGSMGDDREAQRQRDRARDREEREREMDRGMTDRERERTVRRRSSKACDQCRKSKCKCERASPNDPCKNCVMLGTPCTFLGPSRKRGPPKGYIDAIEARLHQTEALLGIMLSTRDERARSLLKDIGKDPLAREIITRVDNSPYGVKGRKDNGSLAAKAPGRTLASTAGTMGTLLGAGPEDGSGFAADDEDEEGDTRMDDMLVVSDQEGNMESSKFDLTSTHPSNEWQDRVSSMLDARAAKIAATARANPSPRSITRSNTNAVASSSPDPSASHADVSSSGHNPNSPTLHQDDHAATGRRTRRRVGEAEYDLEDERDLAGSLMHPPGHESERSDSAFRADRDRDSSNANSHMLQNTRFSDNRAEAGPSRNQHSTTAQDSSNNGAEHHPRVSNVPSSTTRLLNHSRSLVNMHRGYAKSSYRTPSPSDSDDSDNLEGAIGKLSINEDDQVRYHGKASGLYLLAATSSVGNPRSGLGPDSGDGQGIAGVGDDPGLSPQDPSMTDSIRPQRGRREDGIWRFPKARVWPPLPSDTNASEEMSPMYMASAVGNIQYAPSLRQSGGPPGAKTVNVAILPPREVQTHLLALYFAHVQPIFPIVHKKAFWEGYNVLIEQIDPGKTYQASPQASNYASESAPPSLDGSAGSKMKKLKPVSALLLFAMFAVASRYDERFSPPKPADPFRTIWTSGDEYLDRAHKELGATHGVSHGQASGHCAETVQALLLLGYREIGIGAMAQAWGYVGWGIRMAQDLGMHRSAEGWERGDREPVSEKANESQANMKDGGSRKRQLIFTAQELSERKRIWYGCIIMDTYASTTIGRPLMIFEWDYDTPLPDPEDASSEERVHMQTINEVGKELHNQCVNEEWERWTPEESPGGRAAREALSDQVVSSEGLPSRSISCFNASAILSGILSTILQTVYAVRAVSSRHAESMVLEGVLDKWYLSLPEHLRFEPATCTKALKTILNAKGKEKSGAPSSARLGAIQVPPSHVLTLHMHYWCAVLLLHRPFIRQVVASAHAHVPSSASSNSETHGGKLPGQSAIDAEKADTETRAVAEKSFELCNAAANHITSLVALYQEQYVITHCPAYFVYYVFTATIAHDITLTVRPGDPQAKTGLQRCIRALRSISTVWPGAARAIELFGRSRIASAQGDDVHVARTVNNSEATPSHNKRVATHDVEALNTAPGVPSTQSSGHLWSSTNDATSARQEQNASVSPRPSITPASVNAPYDPTTVKQQPQNPLQPSYNYQPVQNSLHIPQNTVYPPPGLYRAEKSAMSILAASTGANDSFYRLHPQPPSRTNLDLDVRPINPQFQQQQRQAGSPFNPNPNRASGDNDGNAIPSWPPTTRVRHPDLAAIDTSVHGGFATEPPMSMAALPHLYHNTGIVDQSGHGFHPHAHAQQQGSGQYPHLPQQYYVQHPSSLAIGGASARRTQYAQAADTQPLSAFENYESSYAPQTNLVGHQPPHRPQQPQDGVYTAEQGYGMFDNPQYYNNQ